jgi:hypothetical protein
MALQARLDSTGRRVLCGVRDCGVVIGYIADGQSYNGPIRQLYFESGFRPRDGVWERSTRAAVRVRGGHKPQARRRAFHVFGLAAETEGSSPVGTPHPTPREFPARVKCLSEGGCGSVNLLDRAVLGITKAGPLEIPPDPNLCECCKAAKPFKGRRIYRGETFTMGRPLDESDGPS